MLQKPLRKVRLTIYLNICLFPRNLSLWYYIRISHSETCKIIQQVTLVIVFSESICIISCKLLFLRSNAGFQAEKQSAASNCFSAVSPLLLIKRPDCSPLLFGALVRAPLVQQWQYFTNSKGLVSFSIIIMAQIMAPITYLQQAST